jgi:hypothetical protein
MRSGNTVSRHPSGAGSRPGHPPGGECLRPPGSIPPCCSISPLARHHRSRPSIPSDRRRCGSPLAATVARERHEVKHREPRRVRKSTWAPKIHVAVTWCSRLVHLPNVASICSRCTPCGMSPSSLGGATCHREPRCTPSSGRRPRAGVLGPASFPAGRSAPLSAMTGKAMTGTLPPTGVPSPWPGFPPDDKAPG